MSSNVYCFYKMNVDDVIYVSLLVFTLLFGYIYRRLGQYRQWTGSFIGFCICYFVSGLHTVHPLLITGANIVLLKTVSKRYCHVISFFGTFLYLLFFRLCHYCGLPAAPAHTNAVQMMVTLKLVGICFEVHDTWRKEGELKKSDDVETKARLEEELKYERVNPTPLDIFHYVFCYIGILTGPYYKFRVYEDMLNGSSHPNCFTAMLHRIRVVPLYGVLFLLTSYYFPLSFAESDEIFRNYGILYRIWYMTPVFFTFRMRIYGGFVLSECVCIMAGLGAYPVDSQPKPGRGPSNYKALSKRPEDKEVEYNFETIHNIDEWGSDFTPTVRGGMRCWNMTVQYWLASNVYRRLRLIKPVKEALTMLTSAFWHGVYSGYYLSLLTVPFILAVEDYYERVIRVNLSEKGKAVYDKVTWFLKMQHFSYMGMAFLLLQVDTTIRYWRSIGFIYHGVIIFMHAIAQYINLISAKVDKKLQKSRDTACLGDSKLRVVRRKETAHKMSDGATKKD